MATAWPSLGERAPFAAVVARLRAVEADLADIASGAASGAEDIEGDPERLAAVQERRAQLADLRRRYSGGARSTLAELSAVRDELSRRLEELDGHAERAAAAEADRRGQRRRWRRRPPRSDPNGATTLQPSPERGARTVARPRPGQGRGASTWATTIPATTCRSCWPSTRAARWLRWPRPRPVGSWRTMLALRLIVGAQVPTLVFDEVDAGVGGAAARSVGRALAALAVDKQVLVVTHLPQVAAFADAQVALTKQDDGASTVMRAEVLGAEPRVRELARMLSASPTATRARTTPRSSWRRRPRSGVDSGAAATITACRGRSGGCAPESARRTSPSGWSPATSR